MARSDGGKWARKQPISLSLSLHVHFQFREQEQEFGQEMNHLLLGWGTSGGSLTGLSERVAHPHAVSPSMPSILTYQQTPVSRDACSSFLFCFFDRTGIGVPLTAVSRSHPLAWNMNMGKALVLAIVLFLVECATCGAGRMTASGGLPRLSSSGGLKGALRRPIRLKGGGETVGESDGAPNVSAASNDNDGGRDTTVVTQTFISNKVGLKPTRDATPPCRSRCATSCQSQLQPPMGLSSF